MRPRRSARSPSRWPQQFESATIFGASLSATFLGSDAINVKIVTSVLIVLMSATTFLTQRQLMTKNMPASALDNPFAKQQKLLLYVLPVVFAVSGVNFPIGVLIYWFTTNVWSMCQQFYVIRRMPAPGSAAEKAYHARLERKGKPIPGAAAAKAKADAEAAEASEAAKQSGQRQQPASKKRKKNKAGGAKPAGQACRQTDRAGWLEVGRAGHPEGWRAGHPEVGRAERGEAEQPQGGRQEHRRSGQAPHDLIPLIAGETA